MYVYHVTLNILFCEYVQAGPVGEVKLFYVNECEPPIEEEMTLESNLETVDYEEKALNFKLILPFDVDDTFNVLINLTNIISISKDMFAFVCSLS